MNNSNEKHRQIAAAIKQWEYELLQPETRKSISRINELLADDFFEIGALGKCYNKQDVLIILPARMGEQFTMTDFRIKELFHHLILATYRVTKEMDGTTGTTASLRSSIWQRSNGQWKMVFHQGTIIP